MISFVSRSLRNIGAAKGDRHHLLELTAELAKFIPSFKENDLAIFLYIALSSNEYGCASFQISQIASRFSMSEEGVIAAFKRLNSIRLDLKRLILFLYVNDTKTGLFQIVLPTDEEIDKLNKKKVKEFK